MNMERILRGMAGTVVLISLILTATVHQNFIWLTAFVGINLLQSAFSNWCPAMMILRKLGFGGAP